MLPAEIDKKQASIISENPEKNIPSTIPKGVIEENKIINCFIFDFSIFDLFRFIPIDRASTHL